MSNPTERLKNKTTLVAEASRGIGRVINISPDTSLSDFLEKMVYAIARAASPPAGVFAKQKYDLGQVV